MPTVVRIPLRGPAGEPVDLVRTFASHGAADLPPMNVADGGASFEVTLALPRGRPRTVRLSADRDGSVRAAVSGRSLSDGAAAGLKEVLHRVLGLDEDLSPFYSLVADDPQLAWATRGAGRMIRTPTVFETVVKTICTTNCAWSFTQRMVATLVAELGEPAPDAPAEGWRGRAFPTPTAMASAGPAFYRDVLRAGYRGAYLLDVATSVAEERTDLESLGRATRDELPDDELDARLRALPGVGPYAAAHIMMMIGRHSRLILDSWTRPKYARLVRRKTVVDATIVRRFRRYGDYAGLAFWLFLTRDWVAD